MILTVLRDSAAPSEARPAWEVFLETEKRAQPPCAIVFQSDHAVLAGDLARALDPDVFGEIPDEVIEAISQHDLGWNESDLAQLRNLANSHPQPFPRLSIEQGQEAWEACVRHARSLPALMYVLISRHFTALAADIPGREDFGQTESARRLPVERELSCPPADLERWMNALGFCDLLSLYLCCGSRQTATFPLAHPSIPASRNAPRVTVSWDGQFPRFSRRLTQPGAEFAVPARVYSGAGGQTAPLELSWQFE
jgi:hypothetical protein